MISFFRRLVPGLFLGVGLLPAACGPKPPTPPEARPAGPPWFAEVTQEVGLSFVHDAGPLGAFFMPQIMGSGAAVLDFDGDGRFDVYLVHNVGPGSKSTNRLFRQGSDGKFTDVSAGSGLDVAGHGQGAAAGDVNNDGKTDVCLLEYSGARLFLNNGNGTFAEVTREAGLDCPLWGSSAAFFDYDRDGWLDLVVVNYVDYDPSVRCANAAGRRDYCHPSTFPGTLTRLFRNRGVPAGGKVPRFEDVTVKAGLGRLPGPGLGVLCADFDGDHWPDMFVANDSGPNRLWINGRDGTFREEAVLRGVAYNAQGQAQANMGVAWGDIDGDGLNDLFVTHLTDETHALWKQGPRGQFRDQTVAAGLAGPRARGTGFGTVLADFNHDGAPDLAVVNGRVSQRREGMPASADEIWTVYRERNQLFGNDGQGRFTDISDSNPTFCGRPGVCRGLCLADFNNDGAPDLLLTEVAGPARLFRNVAPDRGHWLLVRAVDPALRRDAYGAEVVVRAGGRRWLGLVNPGFSYQCSNDPRAHFGLGKVDRFDGIDVVWPDGSEETFAGGAADQQVVLHKGEGQKK